VRSSAIVLFLVAFAPVTASEVTATRLNGDAIVGILRAWDDKEVAILTAAGEQRLAADDLLSLQWSSATPNQASDAIATVSEIELIDGSVLPVDEFHSSGAETTATLAGPFPTKEKTLVLPRKQLAAVRLKSLQAAAAAQWKEIRELEALGDVLVLLKRDGKSLDYIEGVLGDVSGDKIDFKIEGESVRIDRAKVAGFTYYHGESKPRSEPQGVVLGRSGLRANVLNARLTDGVVSLTTAGGTTFDWPIQDIFLADLSAGKLFYLSDVEPASQHWTPLVGLPAEAALAAEYGEPRRNRSAYGGSLTLSYVEAAASSPTSLIRQFNKGLALRSRSELIYRLPAGYRRFTALAGIDPATRASGDVLLQIYGDDRSLLEAVVAGHEPPVAIDLDISGVKRLKIVVDFGHNLDTGDWLNLCDARVVK
jgi:NPCBM/NEW2 domain